VENKKTTVNNFIPWINNFFLTRKKLFVITMLLAIILSGAFLRFYNLEQIPSGLHETEANYGLLALGLNDEETTINSFVQNGYELGVFTKLTSVSFGIFGMNIFALRLLSAFIGILTIIGFFFLLKELRFSYRLALLGTFFLTFSFWHVNFSRLAYSEIFIPFLITWLSLLLMRGFFSKKHLYFVLSGATIGLGLWIHPLMIFSLLLPFFLVLYFSFLDKKFLSFFKLHLLFLSMSILLFSVPLLLQMQNDHHLFQDSLKGALSFDASNLSPIKNMVSYFGSLFYLGDSNQLHNYSSLPIIPLAWSILFLFGFFLSMRSFIFSIIGQFKKTNVPKNIHASALAQIIFLTALLIGSLNSNQEPSSKQFIWAIPAIFIFCIIPFEYLIQIYQKLKLSTRISMKKWRWRVLQFSISCLILMVVLAGFSQVYLYFEVWAKDTKTKEVFQENQVSFGKIIRGLEREENNFIIIPEHVEFSADRKTKTLKTLEFSGFPDIKNYVFIHPSEGLTGIHCENSLIVFYETKLLLRKQFQKKCPENSFKKLTTPKVNGAFWTMRQ